MNSKMIVINSGLAWMVNLVICLHFKLDFFFTKIKKKKVKRYCFILKKLIDSLRTRTPLDSDWISPDRIL